MRRIYVEERETVWHRTTVDLPDDWTDEKIKEYLYYPHDPYELVDAPGARLYNSEYLYETGEYTGEFKIIDTKSDKLIEEGWG